MVGDAGHREIDHTADLAFELWAGELASLYGEAVRALAELCYDRDAVDARERRSLRVEGSNNEERMVRWLQEVYLQLESDLWLAADAVGVVCDDGSVSGTLLGESFDAERHTLHTEIKAVTYHGMEIVERDGVWQTLVIVDV